jgi:3-dehydroquinate synthase
VSKDENESGPRAILNFGHTIGHALEAISAYGKYLHGEAISIGQVAAARISQKQNGLKPEQVSRISSIFARCELPTAVDLNASQMEKALQAMKLDKKVRDGKVGFVLASRIGKVDIGCSVEQAVVRETLKSLNS